MEGTKTEGDNSDKGVLKPKEGFAFAPAVPNMRSYKCHKVVQAAKITEINVDVADVGHIALDNGDVLHAVTEYIERCKPEVGGYYVVYKDGYKSYSPAKAFEEGYSPMN